MKQALIIFAKNEVYGKVKTRLAATTGHQVAMCVYQELLQHTCNVSKDLLINKTVFYSDSVVYADRWSNDIFQKKVQYGGGLGTRMQKAFEEVFARGMEQVVIIGTDCLELNPAIIMQAFEQLRLHDVVIGPAKDGGYYLLGMRRYNSTLFSDIKWSTDLVLSQTLDLCREQNLSVFQLEVLSDIDTEEDWKNAAKYHKRVAHD